MYDFLKDCLKNEYTTVGAIKETEEKSLLKMRHNSTGRYFLIRKYAGEAQTYRKMLHLKCRYLPEIFEAAEKDGKVLVIEEYIAGDVLSEMISGSRFTEKETRKIASDLCKALYALHQLGIVHRDVKLSNVMIRQGTDDAVLLDFDASRTIKTEQKQDTVQLGTVGYAAPEQYGIAQTDSRSDIYALGVLMNLMLTGMHPSEQLAKGRIGRVISKCTMVHPNSRYKDVIRLAEALGV